MTFHATLIFFQLFDWLDQIERDASLTHRTAYHDRITGDVLTLGDWA